MSFAAKEFKQRLIQSLYGAGFRKSLIADSRQLSFGIIRIKC